MSGPTLAECMEILEQRIPNGSDSDLALFTTLPNRAGVGAVEVSSAWYSRVSAQDWYTEVLGGRNARRVNAAEIAFASSTEPVTVEGWGLYKTGTDTLQYWGPLRDAAGNVARVALGSGDNLVWAAGDFVAFSITPAFGFTRSVMISKELLTVTTTDATPENKTVYTLSDEEQARVEVVITANGRSADKHYERRILATYYRDGGTTSLQYTHAQDTDGAATRNNLTTATASLAISGHNVQAQLTGEAATTLDWVVTAEIRSDDP